MSNVNLIQEVYRCGFDKCLKCGSHTVTFSHFFKSNTVKGNPRWNYDNFQNGFLLCVNCHTEFEKLPVKRKDWTTVRTRFDYVREINKPICDKIIKRMAWILEGVGKEVKVYVN